MMQSKTPLLLRLAVRWRPALSRFCRLLPELQRFPTDEERRSALLAAARVVNWNRIVWIALLVYAGLMLYGMLVIPNIYFAHKTWFMLIFLFVLLLAASVGFWASRIRLQNQLRLALRDQGIPICLKCGYNLYENHSGICPECGSPVGNMGKGRA